MPEPKQGLKQWTFDFYSDIRYPASARENGIGGTVILNVVVNEFGIVEDITVKEGVTPDIDKEALRCGKKSTKVFTPLIIDGKSYRFRVEVPVKFRIE